MDFDDWAYDKHRKVLFNNETGDIWLMPYFKELMHAIRNNQDIESIISDKNQKLHDMYIAQEIEPLKQQIAELNTSVENYATRIREINKISKILNNFKKDIEIILTKHIKIIDKDDLKSMLFDYFNKGVFYKGWKYKELTQPPAGIINHLTKGLSFKSLKKDLDAFLQKYEQLNITNTINDFSISKDPICKGIIGAIISTIKSLSWQEYDFKIKELEKNRNTLIEQYNWYKQRIKDINNQILNREKSFQNSKVIQKEDSIIRSFAQELKQEIQQPKQLDTSNYVVGLNDMPDDEVVMFNLGLSKNLDKIQNVFKYNNLEIGNQTDKWYIHRETRNNSDEDFIEVFSPLMTVKDAKLVMPKLIYDLDRAHAINGLVVPIKARQLFANLGNKPEQIEIGQDDFEQLIHLPSAFFSLSELKKRYPKDKFLFSGLTASDDYLLVSGRIGRTGTIYATPNIEYAVKYDGVTNIGSQEGTTATGDRYVSSVIGKLDDKDVMVGFINIYKQNPKDMFFPNFGMEEYRAHKDLKEPSKFFDMCEYDEENQCWKDAHKRLPKQYVLTRDEAINGFFSNNSSINIDGKEYSPVAYNSETFVTPEKNQLVEKILHIKCGINELFIPVNENKTNKVIQAILNKRVADTKRTFQYSLRENVLKRLEKQEKEYEEAMFEKGKKKILKKDNIYTNDFSYDR